MALPEITGDLSGMAGASPKTVATISFARSFEWYMINMGTNPDFMIERATITFLMCCPESEKRKAMWDLYIKEKSATNETNAAYVAVGELYSYMSDAMGLYEKSTGAW